MRRARRFPVLTREGATAPSTKACAAVQQLLPLGDVAPQSLPAVASATERLWFCIYLPNLVLEASGGDKAPRAVVADQHGIQRVLLANASAAAVGIMPGQSTNAALALLPTLLLEERSLLCEQQALESLATWLERFSSFVSVAGNDVLLLEVAGSLRLFGGLPRLRQQVSAGLEQQGFVASLAIAPTPLAATWLARAQRRVCIRAAVNLAPVLRSLPLHCLNWPPAITESLTGMGVTNIGDCLRLPREGFAKRFSTRYLLELDRALGCLPDPRASWRAPEQFHTDYEISEEQTDRELLLAICNELLSAHEQFLLVRQLGTQRIHFSFFHLQAPATTLSLGCAQVLYSAQRWSDLLSLRFERVNLPEPVIAIRLQSGRSQVLQAESGQLALQGGTPGALPSGSAQSAESYSMTQLAGRLAARMGKQSVSGITTAAEHRPQHAGRSRNLLTGKVCEALSFVGRGLTRPLWMLPEPTLLAAVEGCPLHQGPLRLLEGPERLETGWWDENGIARDYYTAVNPHGIRLWVFRMRNATTAWYLHGFFG